MSDSPFFQFYPSDWLAGTRGLTATETGVYITLIAMMYEAEGRIQNDPKRLARLCGTTPGTFNKAIDGLLETGKLTLDEIGFSNSRVEIEIKKRTEKRKAASQSANARWKKTEENQSPENADASNSQCERNANQKPEARSHIDKEDPNGSLSLEIDHQPIDEVAEAVHIYRSHAEKIGWPKPTTINQTRRRAVSARIKEAGGIEGWKLAVEKSAASDFLGKPQPFSGFGIDWISKPTNFAKILEGNYDNRNQQQADDEVSKNQRNHQRIFAELSRFGK